MKLGLGLLTVLKVSAAKFLRVFFTLLEVFGNHTHDFKNYP